MKADYINERMLMVRLKGRREDLVIIQRYLEELNLREQKCVCIVLMGIFNASVDGQDGK